MATALLLTPMLPMGSLALALRTVVTNGELETLTLALLLALFSVGVALGCSLALAVDGVVPVGVAEAFRILPAALRALLKLTLLLLSALASWLLSTEALPLRDRALLLTEAAEATDSSLERLARMGVW